MLRDALLIATTLGASALFAGCRAVRTELPPLPPVAPEALRAPADFAGIADKEARAQAMFVEAAKVFLHPRCANCHPADDTPRQGDQGQIHDPPVVRGPKNEGVPALECTSCHQDHNLALARVPGAPRWHLAPKSMAWIGRSPAAICRQIKDPALNGGMSLAKLVDHVAHDELVAWGWSPGHGRTPAPGTQAQLGELVAAWVALGAACPGGEAP